MAVQTKIHGQIFGTYSNRLLRHVAMTLLAIHPRADVRRMPKANVPFRIEPIDALPGDFLPLVRIGCELFDLGLVHRNRLMTCHAETDARNSSIRPLRYSLMAVGAVDIVLYVDFMI